MSAWSWALRAIWGELAGFRFDHESRDVPSAERPGALLYHLDSPHLFNDAMRLDGDGVPYQVSRTFAAYNPAYVAWYGLQQLQAAEARGDARGRERFATQVMWLRKHAVRRLDGAAVWPYGFDWREGETLLRAGWISGMAQGLAMSVLVRAHRLSPDPELLALASAAARVFNLTIEQGGVQSAGREGPLFEEYPGDPPPRVLDGALFALLGLYDVAVETGDARLRELFERGMDGVQGELDEWNYRGKWSWYGRRVYLSPTHYHFINRALLLALARAGGRSAFADVATAWDPRRLGAVARVALYLAFQITKQRSRVRDRLTARRMIHRR